MSTVKNWELKFKPINIIYKPIKSPEKEVLCFSTNDISKLYRNPGVATSDKVSHGFVFECYYCGKFFARADKQKWHIENCTCIPGIIYNFNNKNLITFEDNFKSKGDIPMAIYFDLETTAPTDNCFNPEQKKMFVMSSVLIVAFHPHWKPRKIVVQRSYLHTLQQLTTLHYLTNDQMKCIDVKLVTKLKHTAQEVNRRKCKNALGQMFSVEIALIKSTLLEWFNKKNKSQHLELDFLIKHKYEKKSI